MFYIHVNKVVKILATPLKIITLQYNSTTHYDLHHNVSVS